MKNKYSVKLIMDYVNGNDIQDYNIDDLESDYQFMMEVINYTKDKNMYNLCSDEVKNNYEFIKFMIMTFKKDLNFVNSLAQNYLKTIDKEDITYEELIILMNNIVGKDIFSEYSYYKIKALSIYTNEIAKNTLYIENMKDVYLKKELGLGWILIEQKYNNSDILMEYFAKKIINDILFNNQECKLEELIHNQYNDYDSLLKYGINNFLIEYFNCYDNYLSAYINCNIHLLDNVKSNMKSIKNNWEHYTDNNNIRKFDIFNQEIEKYFKENDDAIIRFNIIQLIDYVAKKLKLEKLFCKYDNYYELLKKLYDDNDLIDEENLDLVRNYKYINPNKLNLDEIKCIRFATNLAKDLFKNNIIDNSLNDYDEKETTNTKCQILTYDFTKNTK